MAHYLPPLLVLLKFLSVFYFFPSPPVGLQVAVLLGALIRPRSRPGRGWEEGWNAATEMGSMLGHAGVLVLWTVASLKQ